MSNESRRMFLGKAAVAAPAVAVLGTTITHRGEASAAQPVGKRRVIAGRPNSAFSRAVILDRLAYVSGSLGRTPGSRDFASEFEPQCRQALENLKVSVESAGSSMANVLKCTCYLTDRADFATFNKLFRQFFPAQPPARSTVVVKELVAAGAKVEIDCVASLD